MEEVIGGPSVGLFWRDVWSNGSVFARPRRRPRRWWWCGKPVARDARKGALPTFVHGYWRREYLCRRSARGILKSCLDAVAQFAFNLVDAVGELFDVSAAH